MNKTLAVVVGGRKQPAVLSHVNTTTTSLFGCWAYIRGRNG